MNAGVRYGDIVRTGARHLAEAGIDDAYFEARLLMRVITGMSAARWIMSEQDAAPPVIAERYERMIRERMTRRPLQHILGTTEFGMPACRDSCQSCRGTRRRGGGEP